MKGKIKLIAFLCSLITFCSFLAAWSDTAPVFGGGVKRKLPVYAVGRDDKKIAITFDCAWGVEHTDEILENVEKFGVKCTFFAVQFWVEKYPEYVGKLAEKGVEIGTHSATHSHMKALSCDEDERELVSSSQAIEKITGKKVTLFRAPFGEYDDKLIATAEKLGLQTVQWDVDSLDWKDLGATEIATRIIGRVKSGSIILCHNNGKHTAEALPLVFADLISRGYEFVTVSELLLSGETTIDESGVQRRIQQ